MRGFRTPLKKAFKVAKESTKIERIFDPTPEGRGGSRAYQDNNIRIDHGQPGTGNRVVQIQSQTKKTGLKAFIRKYGTHAKVATVKVKEGEEGNVEEFFNEVLKQVK